jgi:hypothetical protein
MKTLTIFATTAVLLSATVAMPAQSASRVPVGIKAYKMSTGVAPRRPTHIFQFRNVGDNGAQNGKKRYPTVAKALKACGSLANVQCHNCKDEDPLGTTGNTYSCKSKK